MNEYPLNIMCGPEVKLRHIVNINRIPPGSVSFGVDTAPIKMPVYNPPQKSGPKGRRHKAGVHNGSENSENKKKYGVV